MNMHLIESCSRKMFVTLMACGMAMSLSAMASNCCGEATPAAPAKPAAAPAKPADTYPLDTCVVTGAKLGEMGEVVKYDYNGREIRFCCKGCISTFKKDPAKYLKILDDAAAKKAAK